MDGLRHIANGRVLLTPAESGRALCLTLPTATPHGLPSPRGEHYYVACVYKGLAGLVGRDTIDAIHLEDGSNCLAAPYRQLARSRCLRSRLLYRQAVFRAAQQR